MKNGFTLAETLIALTILGVLAAIAITSIVQHYKRNFVEVRLRQAYSMIDNALELAKVQNNTNFETMFTPVGSNYYQMEFADKYIIPNLSVQKDCGCENCGMPKICSYTKSSGKLIDFYASSYNGRYFIGLQGSYGDLYKQYSSTRYLQLKNGMYLYIYGTGNSATFIFDINGAKNPNKFGYDIFAFTMFRPKSGDPNPFYNCQTYRYCNKGNKLFPGYGSGSYEMYNRPDDRERQNCTINGFGQWCSGLIMYNNWKIPEDYPIKWF